jgi:hypothetical protein
LLDTFDEGHVRSGYVEVASPHVPNEVIVIELEKALTGTKVMQHESVLRASSCVPSSVFDVGRRCEHQDTGYAELVE